MTNFCTWSHGRICTPCGLATSMFSRKWRTLEPRTNGTDAQTTWGGSPGYSMCTDTGIVQKLHSALFGSVKTEPRCKSRSISCLSKRTCQGRHSIFGTSLFQLWRTHTRIRSTDLVRLLGGITSSSIQRRELKSPQDMFSQSRPTTRRNSHYPLWDCWNWDGTYLALLICRAEPRMKTKVVVIMSWWLGDATCDKRVSNFGSLSS